MQAQPNPLLFLLSTEMTQSAFCFHAISCTYRRADPLNEGVGLIGTHIFNEGLIYLFTCIYANMDAAILHNKHDGRALQFLPPSDR